MHCIYTATHYLFNLSNFIKAINTREEISRATKNTQKKYSSLTSSKMQNNRRPSCSSTLEGLQPCILPILGVPNDDSPGPVSIGVDIHHHNELRALLARTPKGSTFLIAWSLVLRCYTNQDHVSFEFHEELPGGGPGKHAVFRNVIDENMTLTSAISKTIPRDSASFDRAEKQSVESPMYNTCLIVFEETEAGNVASDSRSTLSWTALPVEQVSTIYLDCRL